MFTDLSRLIAPFPPGRYAGVAVCDVDGDGRFEVVVGCSDGPNRVLKWVGGQLRDVAPPALTDPDRPATNLATADVNGDGREEIYVGTAGPFADRLLAANPAGAWDDLLAREENRPVRNMASRLRRSPPPGSPGHRPVRVRRFPCRSTATPLRAVRRRPAFRPRPCLRPRPRRRTPAHTSRSTRLGSNGPIRGQRGRVERFTRSTARRHVRGCGRAVWPGRPTRARFDGRARHHRWPTRTRRHQRRRATPFLGSSA